MKNEAKGTDPTSQADQASQVDATDKPKATGKKRGPKPPTMQDITITKPGKLLSRTKTPVIAEDVKKLAALGCNNRDISRYFNCDEDALRIHFADELAKGREEVKITLRRSMLENACVKHNAAVQIFLAKNLLGMSDQGPIDDEENKPLPWNDAPSSDLSFDK